ncbi:hypothetical protein TCAL_03442 [Tigriopus californicus]|uniref:Uncharacterized protein n=1 Tax=Tigriopus californicus TaxID=6832 RepID=A0A553NQI3_TIGCA|nr:hypothetical protein TCAL_03442 [Tigriopus californicus]
MSQRESLVVIFLFLVPCLHALIDPSMFRRNFRPESESEGDLYVFPSMRMDRVVSVEGAPVVEVTYHGKPPLEATPEIKDPPLLPTPVPNRGKVRPPRRKRPRNIPTTRTTPVPEHDANWNPDNFDHTVNPNKSRKTTRPTPAMKRTPESSHQEGVSSRDLPPMDLDTAPTTSSKRFPKMENKFKEILTSSHDFKAWQDLKSKFMKSKNLDSGIHQTTIQDILATQAPKIEEIPDMTTEGSSNSKHSFPNFPPRQKLEQSIKVTPLPDYDYTTQAPRNRPRKAIPIDEKTNTEQTKTTPVQSSTTYRGLTVRPRRPKSHSEYASDNANENHEAKINPTTESDPEAKIGREQLFSIDSKNGPSPFAALPEGFGIPKEPTDPSAYKDPFAGLGPGPRPTPNPVEEPESPYSKVFAELGVTRDVSGSPYSSPYAGSGLASLDDHHRPEGPKETPPKSPRPREVPTHRPQPIIVTPSPTRKPTTSTESETVSKKKTKPPIKKKTTKTFLNYPSKVNMIPPMTTPKPFLSIVTPEPSVTLSSLHQEVSPYDNHDPTRAPSPSHANSSPRVPRDYATSQILQTPKSFSVHHSSATAHPSPLGGPGAKSFQSITIVHPKTKLDQARANEIENHHYQHQHDEKEKSYLPQHITLHTTASPKKKDFPPHLKNEDTVVLSLPNIKPTDIPEGYELIPLDQLTPEYEVVPWNEAKKVLNVTVSSLGEPKPKDKKPPQSPTPSPFSPSHSTYAPSYFQGAPASGEPQSGYNSLEHDYHVPKSTSKPKRDYHKESEPMSGYSHPSDPHHEDLWYKKPPPISPDLPLFYGDKGNKDRPPKHELESEAEKPRPVVKGLEDEGYSSPYSNVIHFGTDFAHKDAPHYPPGHPHYKSLQVFHSVHTTKSPHQVKTIVPHLSTTTAPGGYYPTRSPIHQGVRNTVAYFSTPRPTGYGHSTPKPIYDNPSAKPSPAYEPNSPYENYLEPDHESPYGYPEYPEEPKSSLKPYYESSSKPDYEDSKPIYHSSPKPYESPKPQYHSTPKPSYESPKPQYHSTPKPSYESPKPQYHSTPKPSYESPKPQYHSTPKPSYESPKPQYHSTPNPNYENPKPQYHSTPKPSYEGPKPHYHSTLMPNYESSKPSHEASAPGYGEEPHYHSSQKPTYDDKPQYYSSPKPSYDGSEGHYHSSPDSSHHRPKPSFDHYESHEDPDSHYHSNPEPSFETHEISPYDEGHSIKPSYGVDPEHTTENPGYYSADPDDEDIPHYQANLRPKHEENPNYVYSQDVTPPDHDGFKSSEPDPYYTTPKPSYKHPKSLLSAFKYMPLTSPFNEIYQPIFSHNITPRPPTPTTSVYPYLHWSSPQPQHHQEGPKVHIQHSTPKGTSHENHVKSLTPTPQPGYGSSHYSTPKPSYQSTPKPSYHSTPMPGYGPSTITPSYPHTTTGPPRGYYSGSPTPYGYSPSPNRAHYHSSTTPAPIRVAYSATPGPSRDPSYVKGLDLSHLKLYTPTPPRPRHNSTPFPQYSPSPSYGYSPSPSARYSPSPSIGYSPTPSMGYSPSKPPFYSPTTQKSMVKSLPEVQHSPSPYSHHFVSYQEQYYLPKRSYNPNEYIPQDIPLKVNHFPEIVPTASPLKMDFYTSPQPVYVPGPAKHMSSLPQYQPSHSRHQGHSSETGPQSEVRLQQLQKYLSSIDETDPKSHLNTDILSQLINTLTNNDQGQKIKISIPTHPPAEKQEHSFDIAALQRQPEKSNTLKFASKLFKRKINSGDLSQSEIEDLKLEVESLNRSQSQSGELLNEDAPYHNNNGKTDLSAQESRSNESESTEEQEDENEEVDEWIIRPLEEKDPIPFLEVSKATTVLSSTSQSTPPTSTTLLSPSTTTSAPILEREESALFELFEKFLRDKITSTSTTKGHPTRPSVVYVPEATTSTVKSDDEDESSEEVMKMRISSYDNVSGNNIIIGNNTEQTLKQLTKTLRSLTATVRGLNNTIMEATEKVKPTLEQPMAVIQYMQGEIDKLTKTVSKLQSQQDDDMSREKVKEVLLDVVKEVQKVDQLRNNLSEQGLTSTRPKRKLEGSGLQTTRSDIFIASDGVKTHLASNVDWHTVPSNADEIQALNQQNRENLQETTAIHRDGFTPSDPADHGMMKTREQTNHDHGEVQAYPDIFNIPVSASIGPQESTESVENSAGASLQVIGDENINIRHIGDSAGIVVGTSMPVDHPDNLRVSPSRKPRVTTTPSPLRHSFSPSGSAHSLTSPRPNFQGGFHGSTPMSLHRGSPTPLAGNGPPIYSHWSPTPEPALNKGFAFDNQKKNVRFPVEPQVQERTAQDYDYEQDQPRFGTSYMNSLSKSASVRRGEFDALPTNAVGPTKSGVNIMAELAPPQVHRKNLLDRGSDSEDPYIRPDQNGPSKMEVIMYPSGQLLKSSNPGRPPSSTIGPRLESVLLNSYYRNQLPHYVLAKNRRSEFMEKDTGLFDPQYESDEVITDAYAQYEYDGEDSEPSASSKLAGMGSMIKAAAGDIFPKIVRTATDDLKLMGNVIKLALS